jgi:hypothetical protein
MGALIPSWKDLIHDRQVNDGDRFRAANLFLVRLTQRFIFPPNDRLVFLAHIPV